MNLDMRYTYRIHRIHLVLSCVILLVYIYDGQSEPFRVLSFSGFLIFLPFRFFYTTFYDILSFVYRLFRPDPRLMVTDPLGKFDPGLMVTDRFGKFDPHAMVLKMTLIFVKISA